MSENLKQERPIGCCKMFLAGGGNKKASNQQAYSAVVGDHGLTNALQVAPWLGWRDICFIDFVML